MSLSAFSRDAKRSVKYLLALLPLLATGCSGSSTASPAAVPVPKPEVTLVKPEPQTIRRSIEQPGQIQAYQQTPIYAKIAGFVETVEKDIGDPVDTGDLLAKLKVPELEQELKQKEAMVVQLKAVQSAAKAQVEKAEAMVRRWRSEYERLKTIPGAVDKQVVDETRFQFEAAEAGLKESVANRDKAAADVEVALADERRVAALVDYTKITAPFKGVVSQRNVDVGHFLQPAAGAGGKGDPLFVVVQIDPVRIFVDVPELDAGSVKKGDQARIRIQALRNREFTGKVTRDAFALDPRARTLRTEIDLPNPDGILRPGMYANATIDIEHPNVWTLPAAAVGKSGDLTFCYRVEEGKAVRTPIQVGVSGGQRIEVVKLRLKKDGPWTPITGNEKIVAGIGSLSDGQEVAVKE